jgi:hypothetical protein
LGWRHREEVVRFFNGQFVRGPKYGAPRSFHLVLTRDDDAPPEIPSESLAIRWFDCWLGSPPQRMLKLLVAGRFCMG